MNIITLFCEIDDFFLAYEKWQATQSLPRETPPLETRGHPRGLHPSEVMWLAQGGLRFACRSILAERPS